MPFLKDKDAKVWVAGHRGLVGSGICRALKASGFKNVVVRTHQELDLIRQKDVEEFIRIEKPEYIFLAAARVGGIEANRTQQADFLYENLAIASNIIHGVAHSPATKKLLFLGSSCIYPKLAPQPIPESALLSGPLEPTNEGYAIAKIAGLKLCEMYRRQYGKNFISVMPTNTYGPFDNFHPAHSHVIPGMMRRFHEAKIQNKKEVVVWGTGAARREFLHVDDLAEGLLAIMDLYEGAQPINAGTGSDCTIRELAELMAQTTGFTGKIVFDTSMPDGTPRKVLDVTQVQKLGWKPRRPLKEGLLETYQWAIANPELTKWDAPATRPSAGHDTSSEASQ